MPKRPAKPKVSYYWSEDGREIKATCKLCSQMFWGHNRTDCYLSTSRHKETCPRVVEWRQAMREAGIYVS